MDLPFAIPQYHLLFNNFYSSLSVPFQLQNPAPHRTKNIMLCYKSGYSTVSKRGCKQAVTCYNKLRNMKLDEFIASVLCDIESGKGQAEKKTGRKYDLKVRDDNGISFDVAVTATDEKG